MSNSVNPWIVDYLLDVAREFGAKLFDVQPYGKKKKVQIIEFLTHPPVEQQDTFIWARISDKNHIAIVKFTKKAVAECHASLAARFMGMTRLIQHKGAVASISNFKPLCSRFPLEQGRMSSEQFIIFECDSVQILGSSGESTFGQPKGIEQDPEISLWSKGIAQGGGAGNVLKEKLATEGKSLNTKILPTTPVAVSEPPPLPPKVNTIQRPFKLINDENLQTYKAKWHFVEKDRLGFTGPLIEIIEDVIIRNEQRSESEKNASELYFDGDVDHSATQDLGGRGRSGTPISSWENTPEPRGSAAMPGPSGSLNVVNETQINPCTRRISMARKVPRPASPEPPAAEETGPARVLAPPSDTSQSQSQTMKLGGYVVETMEQLPWMTLEEIGRIMKKTAELRLHNIN